MSGRTIEIERSGAVAWIWMNRPEVHNAFDPVMIAELTEAFVLLGASADVRVIVLAGRGKSFSAGADAEWMRQQGAASIEENTADARRLATLFHTLYELPKPTVARVQGAAIGGGLGLVAACDIVIASEDAQCATSEVRLGLIPATIAPYVVRAIGERHARALFQTGERIDAATGHRIGLLHAVAPADQLDEQVQRAIESLLRGAPEAQCAAKQLVDTVTNRPITAELIEETVRQIASRRASSEAREGLDAFLEKRSPAWSTPR
jgi:methylglutaconyl-CoA hydratase